MHAYNHIGSHNRKNYMKIFPKNLHSVVFWWKAEKKMQV